MRSLQAQLVTGGHRLSHSKLCYSAGHSPAAALQQPAKVPAKVPLIKALIVRHSVWAALVVPHALDAAEEWVRGAPIPIAKRKMYRKASL